jgi:threonine synthase
MHEAKREYLFVMKVCTALYSHVCPFFFQQELFHGPTFAFKDVALQMLGNFFEYFLDTGSNGGSLAVLGATSGDTGSAAMAGLRGKRGVHCVILYPKGRVSPRQELQMTTVQDENVHAVAVENSTFDDCQDMVKASFNTPAFRDQVHLGAVNSINWCRVMAQTTYYFWSYFQVTANNTEKVNYSVPTGNFGDVLAGFYSKQMGLPVGRLVVAVNENDILHRFFENGTYHRETIQKTISPSMDICVSSNFERYLFFLSGNNPAILAKWMQGFEKTHQLTIKDDLLKKAQSHFSSARVDTAGTLRTMAEYHKKYDYVLCPHSAIGVEAVRQLNLVGPKTVCLATAHEGKFPIAVSQAVDPLPPVPPELAVLETLPTRRTDLPKDLETVQMFVRDCVFGTKTVKTQQRNKMAQRLVLTTAVVAAVVAVAMQYMSRRR